MLARLWRSQSALMWVTAVLGQRRVLSPEGEDVSEERPFSHLVVVGSSAGGIEALSEPVSGLPESFPAPIVAVQHLDPHREAARAAAHIALGPLANASGTNRSGYTISALELVYACRLGWETG